MIKYIVEIFIDDLPKELVRFGENEGLISELVGRVFGYTFDCILHPDKNRILFILNYLLDENSEDPQLKHHELLNLLQEYNLGDGVKTKLTTRFSVIEAFPPKSFQNKIRNNYD